MAVDVEEVHRKRKRCGLSDAFVVGVSKIHCMWVDL